MMNWDAIGAVGEILGALAVFASLGYLAIQTRASALATRHAAQSAFVADYNRLLTELYLHPEFADLLSSAISSGFARLSTRDQERFHAFCTQQFLSSFNMWLQVRAGQFDRRLADPLIVFFAVVCKSVAVEWWRDFRNGWDREFVDHIDTLVADPQVPPLHVLPSWWPAPGAMRRLPGTGVRVASAVLTAIRPPLRR
jgi:hypothetical protein